MAEYFHHYGKLSNPFGHKILYDGVVDFGEHRILAVQRSDGKSRLYTAAGVVKHFKHKRFAGVDISEVASLNGVDREGLARVLYNEKFFGEIMELCRTTS